MRIRNAVACLLTCALPYVALGQQRSSSGLEVLSRTVLADRTPSASGCATTPTALCLGPGGRFLVEGTFGLEDGRRGPLRLSELTAVSGFFTYDDTTDVQGVVKVLNVCSVTGSFWVFLGSLTDQEVHLKVTDTFTGVSRQYDNPLKSPWLPIYDFTSFTGCSAPACTYSLGTSAASALASGLAGSVAVLTSGGCSWNAASNASWIHVDPSTATVSGSGPARFVVDANTGFARVGTLTVAGQTFTITQAGSPAGSFDGTWQGTTFQGKEVSFTVVNNALTAFEFGFRATGTCVIDQNVTVTFSPPLPINNTSFSFSSPGTPGAPTSTAFTLSGSFSSPTSMSGSLAVSYASQAPDPQCSASTSGSMSATRR